MSQTIPAKVAGVVQSKAKMRVTFYPDTYRLALIVFCRQHHGKRNSGYCYIQLDGTHQPAASCRCMYAGELCPIDKHLADMVRERLGVKG